MSFAQQVLSTAAIPPDGQAVTVVSSYAKEWLGEKEPPSIPGASPVTDEHELYLYNEAPVTVIDWIRSHLPPGTRSAGHGTETGTALTLFVPAPISGPNEYSATLEYVVAPTSTSEDQSELRVDAVAIWVPTRPATEVAPAGGVVSVTGFGDVTVKDPFSKDPVTVTLTRARAAGLVQTLNSLPLGPKSGVCMEASLLYKISIRPKSGARQSFLAEGWACEAAVNVTKGGKVMPTLRDRTCKLDAEVKAVLPRSAHGTRRAVAGCPTSSDR